MNAEIYPSVANAPSANTSAKPDRTFAKRTTVFFHGCHTHASTAPSNSPLDLVIVLRYKKLMRVSLSAVNASAVPTMTAAAKSPITTAEIHLGIRLFPNTKTNAIGHNTYHCSSTANDHRCRSIGNEFAAKYGVSTK